MFCMKMLLFEKLNENKLYNNILKVEIYGNNESKEG